MKHRMFYAVMTAWGVFTLCSLFATARSLIIAWDGDPSLEVGLWLSVAFLAWMASNDCVALMEDYCREKGSYVD